MTQPLLGEDPDIWEQLRTVYSGSPTPQSAPAPAEDGSKPSVDLGLPKRGLVWWLRAADFTGVVIWTYAFLKVFVFDVDEVLLALITPGGDGPQGILGYRVLLLLITPFVLGLAFWRKPTLWAIGYLMFFPAIVIIWKLPYRFLRYRSWTALFLLLNGLGYFIRSLRYHFITKPLWIFCTLVILFSWHDIWLYSCAVVVIILLAWSSWRTFLDTFRPNWFIDFQTKSIERFINSRFWTAFTKVDRAYLDGEKQIVDIASAAIIVSNISFSLLTNRGIYFWAFNLQRYRQTKLGLLFAFLTYVRLFMGAALAIFLVNLAVLKADPTQFTFANYPSKIAVALYAVSTLLFQDGGGMAAAGDAAYAGRLASGLYGLLFLGVFVLNIFLTFTRERDDAALDRTVNELRAQAVRHEADLERDLRVTIDEACRRLEEMGQGMFSQVRSLGSSIPPEFLEPEPRN